MSTYSFNAHAVRVQKENEGLSLHLIFRNDTLFLSERQKRAFLELTETQLWTDLGMEKGTDPDDPEINTLFQFLYKGGVILPLVEVGKGMKPLPSRRTFSYRKNLLPHPLLSKRERGVSNLRKAREKTGLTMGYPAWNLLYYACFCSIAPWRETAHVVEVGTNQGYSTIVLAQALKDRGLQSPLHTVDIDPEIVEKAKRNVRKAGLQQYVEFHVEDSVDFLSQFLPNVSTVDFAFLDGCHDFDYVIKEFSCLSEKLNTPHSTVYFDNTNWGGVAEALHIIRKRFGGNIIEFDNCSWGTPGNAIWQPDRPRIPS